MNLWEKIGVGIVVVAVLGFVAYNYATRDITGSSAATTIDPPPRVTTLRVSPDLEYGTSGKYIVLGEKRIQELSWDFSVVGSDPARPDTVFLAGVIFTVHTEYPEAIAQGYVYSESGGSLWVATPLVKSGDRYILPFIFPEPIQVSTMESFTLNMQTDIGEVDRMTLPNDARYDIGIDLATDVLLVVNTQQRVAVLVVETVPPIYKYVFETIPRFKANGLSPQGNATRQPDPDHTIAVFDVYNYDEYNVKPKGDVSFVGDNNNSLTIGLEYNFRQPGRNTEIVLKDWSTNKIISSAFVTLPRGEGMKLVTFEFENYNYHLPYSETDTWHIVADTTALMGTAGDTLKVLLPEGEGNIDWGIDGYGNYNHGDILFRGNIYLSELIF